MSIWDWPKMKFERVEREDGLVEYPVTRTPLVRIIWSATQKTIILGRFKIDFGRVRNLRLTQ